MADRDRDRDRDRARYSSSYIPRDRERDRDERSWQMYNDNQSSRLSPAEPGQIVPLPRRQVREWEVERDPRVPPTVGSAAGGGGGGGEAGPSRRRRSRSSEEQDGSRDVAFALESFSRCMHSTLLATTAQALAARHTERLESFPSNQVNPDTLSESRARLDDADLILADKMRSLHSAFTEVMRRATPRNTGGGHQRRDSRSAVEDRQEVQRMIRDKVDFSELASMRKRLEGVERQLDEEAEVRTKDKGKGKEKDSEPIPAPPSDEVAGKRSRAREMLDDMSRRLEKVEGMKEYLENRYFDIQDQLNAKEQEELEVLRLGNGRWKVIEQLRDPDGVIRGLKRRKVREEEEDVVIDLGSEKDDRVVSASAIDEPTKTVQTTSTSTSTSAPPPPPPSHGPACDATVQALRTQVESLQKELTALKEGQAARDKAIADQVTATIHSQLDGMVKSRIMKAVDVVKAQGTMSKSGQRSMTSPAMPSPSLPTIPQNAVLSSPTVTQQTTPGSSTATASRPASASSAPLAPQQVRSTSNPQPRSTNASPQIPNRQPHASPSLTTLPPPRPASHPVGDSALPQQTGSGQARADRNLLHVNIPPPPHFGFSNTPPQPPHSAPPAPGPNPLNRLIDPQSQQQSIPPNPYQSYNQPQGLGIQHNGQPSLSNSAQLMAFQALVNNGGQNGYRAPQPPPPPATDNGGSLVQKMSNVLGAQSQGSYQGDGFQPWSICPQPGPGQ